MRILLLSDTYSEHTEKWALGLASRGYEIGLFSFNKSSYPWYQNKTHITVLYEPNEKSYSNSVLDKLSYVKYVGSLKKSIQLFKPDILHAHYATSYGLIGALSGFHPFVISAWGTDVMKFPQKNIVFKSILKYNLKNAEAICATSNTIKDYLVPITSQSIHVIPFGVDMNEFCKKNVSSLFDSQTFVVGSIKPLEKIYNIDVLIQAFSVFKSKHSQQPIKLIIIGEGSEELNLKKQVSDLKLMDEVVFTGRIPFSEVSRYFNMLDVFVNISDYESFGVSVIEAMACELPVIVTNTGGLKEIVENDNFGSLVEIKNVNQTAQEIEKYFLDRDKKARVGINARKKVMEKYNWHDNIEQMITLYKQVIKR